MGSVSRDIRFVGWATIAFVGLTVVQLGEHLPLLVDEAPLSPSFTTSLRIGFAQTLVALVAAGRLMARSRGRGSGWCCTR
jgi:hypothetical protein